MAKTPRYLQVKQDIETNPQKYVAAEGDAYKKLATQSSPQTGTSTMGGVQPASTATPTQTAPTTQTAQQPAPTTAPSAFDQAKQAAMNISQQYQATTPSTMGGIQPVSTVTPTQAAPTTAPSAFDQAKQAAMNISQPLLAKWRKTQGNQEPQQPTEGQQPTQPGVTDAQLTDPSFWFNGEERARIEEMRRQADEDLISGITADLIPFEQRNLQQDIALIEQSYNEQMARLTSLETAAQEALQSQQASIAAGEAALNASARTVYEANKAAVEYQQKKTEQAYIEMVNLQQLDNKKRETTLELTMSRFGTYDFAQLKGYQEQIMQNTQKVLNLKKEADIEDQKLTDQVRIVNLEYQEEQSKIQAWKTEAISATYNNYLEYINEIKSEENTTTEQKYLAILRARDNVNSKISDLNARALEMRYEATQSAADRAENIIATKNEAIERAKAWESSLEDKYKAEMETLINNYVGTDFSELDSNVKKRFAELEKATSMPAGFMEQALNRMNKENLSEDFEWHGTQVDNAGNLVAIGVQNGMPVAVSLGKVAKTSYPENWDLKKVGDEVYKFNQSTGEYQQLSPSDYADMSEYVSNMAINNVVGQAIASAYPDGYKGGQCGTFLHNFVDMTPLGGGWGDPIATKKGKMNRSAEQVRRDTQPGDVLLTNANAVNGHVMIVTERLEGNRVRVTESNYVAPDRVSNTRVIDLNNPKHAILGAYRGPLKPKYEQIKQEASESAYFDIGEEISRYGLIGGLASSAFKSFTSGASGEGSIPQDLSAQEKLNYLADNYGIVLTGEKKKQISERNSQAYFEQLIQDEMDKTEKASAKGAEATSSGGGSRAYF